MKLNGNLHFNVKLEAVIPDAGIAGLVNTDAILVKASNLVRPFLHEALKTALLQLAMFGVRVKIIESGVVISEAKD